MQLYVSRCDTNYMTGEVFVLALTWLFSLVRFPRISLGWYGKTMKFLRTCNETNQLVLITKKEKRWEDRQFWECKHQRKGTNLIDSWLIRAPCQFYEYPKPIYHYWLNKTSLLKSMENLTWLPALAASSLMSSTAILNAELWKNKTKRHTVRQTRKCLEMKHFRARGCEELTNSCPKDAVAPKDLSKAPMKPSLIVMLLASAGSGNKMDTKEWFALNKCPRSSRPTFR